MAKYVYRVAAAAALAAVSLTACGGGSDSGSGKIEGAKDTPDKPKASASAVPQGDLIDLPDDAKVEVAADKTGDKKKDAVLAAQADILTAQYQLFTDLDPKSPLIPRYIAPSLQQNMMTQVSDAKRENWTVTGKVRYYDRKVKYLTANAAEISYCEDQSKSFSKSTKTHKVKRTPTTAKSFVAFYSVLEKNKNGQWQVSMYEGKPAAKCR